MAAMVGTRPRTAITARGGPRNTNGRLVLPRLNIDVSNSVASALLLRAVLHRVLGILNGVVEACLSVRLRAREYFFERDAQVVADVRPLRTRPDRDLRHRIRVVQSGEDLRLHMLLEVIAFDRARAVVVAKDVLAQARLLLVLARRPRDELAGRLARAFVFCADRRNRETVAIGSRGQRC